MPEVRLNPSSELFTYPVKRTSPRRGLANLREVKARLGAAGEAVVLDLSEHGIGVQLQIPLQPGSSVPIDMDLPESCGHLRVDGRVVWSTPARRAGIQFEKIPDAASERLKRWISLGIRAKSADLQPRGVAEDTVNEAIDEPATLEGALAQVLGRAVTITKATGAAIAIGTAEKMVCRASQGNAPDVGTPIQPDSGLTGHCVRSRAIVHCEDTDADERVNAEACREMEVRSVLIVPVFSGKEAEDLSGLLEVFSSQPRAFTPEHIGKLEKLTKILGVVASDLVKGPEGKDAERTAIKAVSTEPGIERAHSPRKIGERPDASLQRNATRPIAPELTKSNGRESVPIAKSEKPSGVAEVKPAALVAPVVTTQIDAKETAVKLAEFTNQRAETASAASAHDFNEWLDRSSKEAEESVVSDAVVLPAPTLLIESPSVVGKIQVWIRAAGAEGNPLRKVLRVIGVIVIALELAAALFLYSRWDRKHVASTAHSQAPIVLPPPKPVFFEPPVPVPAPTTVTETKAEHKRKKPADQNASVDDGSDDVIVNRLDGSGTPTPNSASEASGSQKASEPAVITEADPPAPAPLPEQANLAAIHLPDDPAKPSLAVRLSSGTTGGNLIKRVNPTYPETARMLRLQGQVILKAHVAKDGSVNNVQALKGNRFLSSAAEEAVRQWRYSPMKLNGVPVEMDTTVTVQFKLPN